MGRIAILLDKGAFPKRRRVESFLSALRDTRPEWAGDLVYLPQWRSKVIATGWIIRKEPGLPFGMVKEWPRREVMEGVYVYTEVDDVND